MKVNCVFFLISDQLFIFLVLFGRNKTNIVRDWQRVFLSFFSYHWTRCFMLSKLVFSLTADLCMYSYWLYLYNLWFAWVCVGVMTSIYCQYSYSKFSSMVYWTCLIGDVSVCSHWSNDHFASEYWSTIVTVLLYQNVNFEVIFHSNVLSWF